MRRSGWDRRAGLYLAAALLVAGAALAAPPAGETHRNWAVLLDSSASMTYRPVRGGPTTFERALGFLKAFAREYIRDGDCVVYFTFDSQPHLDPAGPFWVNKAVDREALEFGGGITSGRGTERTWAIAKAMELLDNLSAQDSSLQGRPSYILVVTDRDADPLRFRERAPEAYRAYRQASDRLELKREIGRDSHMVVYVYSYTPSGQPRTPDPTGLPELEDLKEVIPPFEGHEDSLEADVQADYEQNRLVLETLEKLHPAGDSPDELRGSFALVSHYRHLSFYGDLVVQVRLRSSEGGISPPPPVQVAPAPEKIRLRPVRLSEETGEEEYDAFRFSVRLSLQPRQGLFQWKDETLAGALRFQLRNAFLSEIPYSEEIESHRDAATFRDTLRAAGLAVYEGAEFSPAEVGFEVRRPARRGPLLALVGGGGVLLLLLGGLLWRTLLRGKGGAPPPLTLSLAVEDREWVPLSLGREGKVELPRFDLPLPGFDGRLLIERSGDDVRIRAEGGTLLDELGKPASGSLVLIAGQGHFTLRPGGGGKEIRIAYREGEPPRPDFEEAPGDFGAEDFDA